jgi:uncharacterized protein (DUF1684 family)
MNRIAVSFGTACFAFAAISVPAAIFQAQKFNKAAYIQETKKWRADATAELTGQGGWLSVDGLIWLHEGDNVVGSGDSADVKLDKSAGPTQIGTLELHSGQVTLTVLNTATATEDGQLVNNVDMQSDKDRVKLGDVTIMVIKRGQKVGVRVINPHSESKRTFKGRRWFPIDPNMLVAAKFVPYVPVRSLSITNVLGDTSPVPCPGYVEFSLHGKKCRLDAQSQGSGLFFNFKDTTNGTKTYPAGRFLDAPAPANGVVMLDFNKAVNPPCAFTKFATCPLPPKSNFLKVPVSAGELDSHIGRRD